MKKILITLLIIISVKFSFTQSNKPIMLGVTPSISVEQGYGTGDFDLNIIPFVIEYPIIDNVNIRLTSIGKYSFRIIDSALRDIGGELAIPVYFNFTDPPRVPNGLYIAPALMLTRNIHYNHNTASVFFEPGYNFLYNDKFSLILGLQIGRKYFLQTGATNVQQNYYGIKIVLGIWAG